MINDVDREADLKDVELNGLTALTFDREEGGTCKDPHIEKHLLEAFRECTQTRRWIAEVKMCLISCNRDHFSGMFTVGKMSRGTEVVCLYRMGEGLVFGLGNSPDKVRCWVESLIDL